MQGVVVQLIKLGPMPPTVGAGDTDLNKVGEYEHLLFTVYTPVTDDEAVELVKIFGPDDCFGLSWTLVHIIETAPGWPLWSVLSADDKRDGIRQLRDRASKG